MKHLTSRDFNKFFDLNSLEESRDYITSTVPKQTFKYFNKMYLQHTP